MPEIHQMREFLLTLYGERWKERVKKMSDKQIIATYYNIKNQEKK